MSHEKDNTFFTKTGTIQLREGKRGLEFWAFNHEHGKPLHVGTLSGLTYEKTAPILEKPSPSFCLPRVELAAVEEAGGQFIRFIGRGRPGTFAISVQDFKSYGTQYFNRAYGYQIRVPLSKFVHSSKVGKRNVIIDNPPVEVPAPMVREKQMSLFG